MAQRILVAAGYTVLVAANGRDALELCAREGCPIDLVLSDVVMPGMGGRELADRLVALYPAMKVLFMSGYTDDELLRQGIESQHVDLVAKPFRPADLRKAVKGALAASASTRRLG